MPQMKSFFDLVNELSMKSDKKLPNLKEPIKGKKGVSKFMRMKIHNAPYTSDYKKAMNADVHSADKKPEKYVKPDGKVGIRMVKVDKEVIKQEASVLKPTKPTDITKHARTLARNDDDYNRNKKKYIDKARAKVFRMYPKEETHDPKHIKQAIGIASDPRYKKGNMTGAVKTMNKLSKDIHKHPQVAAVLRRQNEDVDIDEALNLQQRMKRSRLMKRMKSRIKIGRQRAMRKMANKKTIEKRAMRQARNQLAKKLTRGIPKKELTFARKQEIEKRLAKPALQSRIKRIAKRIFKDVRKAEVQRKKG